MAVVNIKIADNGIADVCLYRKSVNNAISPKMIVQLTEGFTELGENDAVRIIILRGMGAHFCAGADINWMKEAADFSEQENFEDAMRLSDMLNTIYTCPKPVIAAVHGSVYGGGVGLAACADIAIANEATVFCLSEVKLGLTPATISPYVIEAIGARQARRYFLSAEIFSAAKAEAIGLVHKVVVDPVGSAQELAKKMLNIAPGAQADAKKLIHHVSANPLNDELRAETAKRIAARRTTAEAIDGLSAFLNKRKPGWIDGDD